MRCTWLLVVGALALAAGCGGDDNGGVDQDGSVDTTTSPPQDSTIVSFDTTNPTTVEGDAVTDTSVEVDTRPPEPGEFGYACDKADDCNSGWCVQTANGRQCTKTCDSECPSFYDCREAPGTDAIFICVPRNLHLCDPCEATADCNGVGQTGNYCLSYADKGRFCGVRCENDPDCPGGYVCRLVPVGGGGEAKQCVPADGAQCSCSPYAKQLQLSTTCFVENGNGKCLGERFCTQLGLNTCDAAEPFPESCNGQDDNCNGITDEFPPDYQCMIENEFGSCPGQGTCTDGVESCVGTAAAPESCDGIDNDCDGETDEGLCDDSNPCTIDFCNDDGECEHTNDNTQLCDDGSVCTQVDKCQDGECLGFNPLVCDDGNICTRNNCDPTIGCLYVFDNGSSCEDGQPCTKDDKCNQGICVAGSWDTCDDGNPCTVDMCVAGQGCTHINESNGTACGGGADPSACSTGTCQAGICQGTPIREGLTCNRSVGACEKAICRAGTCVAENINSTPQNPTICSRSGECSTGYCTAGSCRPLAGTACQKEISSGFCDDTIPGICTSNGECSATTPPQCQGACSGCASFCGPICGSFCACADFIFN